MADNSTNNGTMGPPQALLITNQVIITLTIIFMMIGMGATITLKEVWENIKKPIGPIIGICCQFIISPFLGWSLALACDLEPAVAIGALAIATCPGGTLSNVLTYLSNGDTCLSVVMTTCSTIFALAFMPLWLFVYSRSWISASALIPYQEIFIALILILIPCGIGMLIKWKLDKYARTIANVCTVICIVGIAIVIVIISLLNPLMFKSSWKPYVVSLLLPLLAYGIGYFIPWALRQGHQKSRTIAFETGVQNTALALTVINIVILKSGALAGIKLGLVPALHAVVSVVFGFSFVIIYYIYTKYKKDKVEPGEEALKEVDSENPADDGKVMNEGVDSDNPDGKVNEGVDADDKGVRPEADGAVDKAANGDVHDEKPDEKPKDNTVDPN
ncbi:ileal sodium/bile acid cotransporter-like [Glandiceps talaboti]